MENLEIEIPPQTKELLSARDELKNELNRMSGVINVKIICLLAETNSARNERTIRNIWHIKIGNIVTNPTGLFGQEAQRVIIVTDDENMGKDILWKTEIVSTTYIT